MSNSDLLLNPLPYGLAFVVSAPAGGGKTTLVEMLIKEFDSAKLNISATTRPKRPSEVEGYHYCFVNDSEFEEKLKKGHFLEHVENFGYKYGTDREYIESVRKKGKHIFLVIDTQGATQLMKLYDAIYIFIMPPSKEVLAERLRNRQTESEESFRLRLARSDEEIKTRDLYDYAIINDDLAQAYQVLRSIFISETYRIKERS